ncbi:MAG TPA: glycosyltransferase family 2 protein [Lacisediminihabitans sp.]|uniref:glycosyltransferase family 2 protein n=1 Tax=Lacisediminihabitans sp. TaxID=2787631 RepID=UPI002EDA7F29
MLSWNGRDDTLGCVGSLVNGSPEVTVLVVDNGSSDGTLEAVRSAWPSVSTLQTGTNLGFSGGMNRGIRWALDRGASCVTVLNNDTVIPEGAMRALREAAARGLAVSPEVMYRDSPHEIWFGEGVIDRELGFPHHVAPVNLGSCQAGLRPSAVLSGCCVTASAAVWRHVGLFDERFFLDFEDSEWSVRAVARGVGLAVVCDVRILHAVSASFRGAAAPLGTFYYVRNGLLFNRLIGGNIPSRWRFLRRRGVSGLRDRSGRDRIRMAAVIGWAVAAYLARSFGPAPRSLQRMAARWG